MAQRAPAPDTLGHDFGKIDILPAIEAASPEPDGSSVQRQTHAVIQPSQPRWWESARLPLQRQEDLGQQIRAAQGGGSPLQAGVRQTLERGLGADLSRVRVHTDGEADQLSRSVNATAFTTGSDIFFRHGAYNPSSSGGMQLLAHEATHTIQQAQGPVAGTPHPDGVSISDPSDRFERAAEATAARVAAPVQRTHEAPLALARGVSVRASSTISVQRDASDPPTCVIDFPTENELITWPSYTIRIGANDSTNNVRLNIDHQWAPTGGKAGNWSQTRQAVGYWWFDWASYPPGEHEIIAEAYNAKGDRYETPVRHVSYVAGATEDMPMFAVSGDVPTADPAVRQPHEPPLIGRIQAGTPGLRRDEPTSSSPKPKWEDFTFQYEAKIRFGTRTGQYLCWTHDGRQFAVLESQVTLDTPYQSVTDPIFSRDPSLDDVKQGQVADCYLLAALSSIAASEPREIRSMRSDNGDGTVTVRLFDVTDNGGRKSFTARYLRIDKSVPKSKGQDLYAQNTLWVQLIEKAYAAGGFTGDAPMATVPSYQAIMNGVASHAFEVLLGRPSVAKAISTGPGQTDDPALPWSSAEIAKFNTIESQALRDYSSLIAYGIFRGDEGKIRDWMQFATAGQIQTMFDRVNKDWDSAALAWIAYSGETTLAHFRQLLFNPALDQPYSFAEDMMRWLEGSGLYPGKRGTGAYTRAQLQTLEEIKKALRDRRPVAVGTPQVVGRAKKFVGYGPSGEAKARGLAGSHAYTVLGVRENAADPDDQTEAGALHWVKLRNPWAEYRRKYVKVDDKLKAQEAPTDATFWLELSDLTKRFNKLWYSGQAV